MSQIENALHPLCQGGSVSSQSKSVIPGLIGYSYFLRLKAKRVVERVTCDG